MKYIIILLTFLVLCSSCEKEEFESEIIDKDLILIQNEFSKMSDKQASSIRSNFNFRQSLERKVHWDFAEKDSLGNYSVPVTLSLPELSREVFSNGKKTFPNQVALYIEDKGSVYSFTMVTYLRKEGASKKKFTGTILTEDYFQGGVRYTPMEDGNETVVKPAARTLSSSNRLTGSNLQCATNVVGTVCVEDFNGGSGPTYCYNKYETTCTYVGAGDWQTPPPTEGGPIDGGSGGSVGPGQQTYLADKEPNSYYWRDLLANGFESKLNETTPLFTTDHNGNDVKNPNAYNCHFHTFGSGIATETMASDGWPKFVLEVDLATYTQVSSNIQVGDVVLYFAPVNGGLSPGFVHSGIVIQVDAQGYATLISSKMGTYEVINHHPRDVPYIYGNTDPYFYTNDGEIHPSRIYFRPN